MLHNDRVTYTKAKTDFIFRMTEVAKDHYRKTQGAPGDGRSVPLSLAIMHF